MATSRKPPPTNVEQNRATLKSLVKLDANKSCADCKKNKHPRWASWNLGIFVCIRCSGIHRGMGTHISKVKSVDLDSWTDEQTQSMIKWGNARANTYWEAKLAPGHQPSEAKIENYIRTKYESKRWVMDGPMPDPSTLDGGEGAPAPIAVAAPQAQPVTSRAVPRQNVDLFGDDPPPARPSTGPPNSSQPPPKAQAAPPKASKPAESLLGLDFFGVAPSPPARPSSELGQLSGNSQQASKTDLKQSILSLYASAPRAAPQPQVQSPSGFGGMHSPGCNGSQSQSAGFGGLGGMNDAFSSLSVNSGSSAAKPLDSFSNLTNNYNQSQAASSRAAAAPTPLLSSGGSFFDTTPAPVPTQKAVSHAHSTSGGFGDMLSASTPSAQYKASAASNDLFDLSAPSPPRATAPTQPSLTATASNTTNPMINLSSAFNLSSSSTVQPMSSKTVATTTPAYNSGMDAWGSSDVWGAPETNTGSTIVAATNHIMSSSGFGGDGGWGSSSPAVSKTAVKPSQTTIAADEDFGGWNSAPTASSSTTAAPKSSGSGFAAPSNDDVFGNVWG